MSDFKVPTKEEVSVENQEIFEGLKAKMGMIPNFYATLALSNNALSSFLNFSQSLANGSLNAGEREVVNLAVSQVNGCRYCLSAHTALAKMHGFSDDDAISFRKGTSEDPKLAALASFAREVTLKRGNPAKETVQALLDAGYTKGGLIDALLVAARTTFTNYVNVVTQIPNDFPVAPDLNEEVAA